MNWQRNSKRPVMAWSKQRLNNLFFFLGLAAVVVMLFTFDVSAASHHSGASTD